MKNNILILLVLIIGSYVSAQEKFAFPGPKGVFVYLGKEIPNGVKVESIQLSRKEGNDSFKKLINLKCATTEQEFITKAKDATKYFPDFNFPSDSSLNIIWQRASKYGLLDSATNWALHPAVRMALGVLYYDLEVKENLKYAYQYKDITSTDVSFPFHPKFDSVSLNMYQYDENGLYLRFQSLGNNPPRSFKVYKYNDAQQPEEVFGVRNQYRFKDTTFYILVDKNSTKGKKYQYSLIGVDQYGNTSYGAAPIIVNLQDFSTVIFNRTKANRAKDFLGITLNWEISDISNVKSIHIFRSTNFDKDFVEVGVMRANDTTFTDDNIEPDKVYYYYLQITDATNTIKKTSAKFFDFGFDTQKPITPIITSAEGMPNGVRLNVSIPDYFIAGFRVFRSENGSSDFSVIADMVLIHPDSSTATFFDTSSTMSGRVFYNYKIQSENTSHIVSDMSNTVQVRPEMSANVASPTQFIAYFQDSSINLFWEDMRRNDNFVSGYKIYKKENNNSSFVTLLSADSIYEGNRFVDKNYETGKIYNYEVESIDLFGYPSKERAVAQVSVPEVLPLAPVISGAINLPDGILLEWTQPNDVNLSKYKIYRYQRGEQPLSITVLDIDKESFLDKTAKSGELYFYTITSLDKMNRESKESLEVGVRH
ncbi:MAG: hypothetical protein M9958_04245 [Chitinophagales bacterium]|nr:hypothetical protein [Chitinophagales bacterium]